MESISSTFTQDEINKMSEIYDSVIVIYKDGESNIRLKPNVTLLNTNKITLQSKVTVLITNLLFIFKLVITDTFSKGSSLSYVKQIRLRLSYLLNYLSIANVLHKKFEINENDFLYSFFTYPSALIPALLKRKNINTTFFSLTHGRDLYEEREPITKKLMFRNFIFHQANTILSVSKAGILYLKDRYPKFSIKMEVYYLGTKKTNDKIKTEAPEKDIIVVSCARVTELKNIHKIPELILTISKETNKRIKWVHFGDFPDNKTHQMLMEEVKILSNNPNIITELKGHTDIKDILSYYETNTVSFFLSISSSEGLPFSMMEAASYGIPIIATDVGGCKEIVTNEHLLLSKHFETIDFIKSLRYVLQFNDKLRVDFYDNWISTFSFEKSKQHFNSYLKH